MNDDVRCPYCDAPQDINHDDGYGYQESVHHAQRCGKCWKEFVFFTSISFSYDVQKADCLNGGEHKWEPTKTVPKECTSMECPDCGASRSPTPEEKIQFDIPPFKPLK